MLDFCLLIAFAHFHLVDFDQIEAVSGILGIPDISASVSSSVP
jgi:hypothetical protein